MNLQRVLIASSTPVSVTWTNQDGTPVDPSPATATVAVTNSAGSSVATGAATRTGVGAFSFTLSPTHTVRLDTLTAVFTSALGSLTATVEVVGGFLFDVADLRADPDFADTTDWPTARVLAARNYAEQEIEEASNVAFVPRYSLDTFIGRNSAEINTFRIMLRTVRSATVAGTTVDPTTLIFNPHSGFVHLWTCRGAAITLGLEYGMDSPPQAIANAALVVAKDFLSKGPIADRSVQTQTELGPIWIPQPGWQGKRFGIPEVDAAIEAHGFAGLLVA
jgi:hypothetical protein